jgi:hypothetical protein
MRSSREGQYLWSGGWAVEKKDGGASMADESGHAGSEMRVLVVSEVRSD